MFRTYQNPHNRRKQNKFQLPVIFQNISKARFSMTENFFMFFCFSQKKLVENMTREGTLADAQTDKILKQHQKQVDKLNTQIDM